MGALSKILTTIQKMCRNLVKLAESTPCFSSIKNEDRILRGIIDERTSRYLFEYYLLRVLICYVELADDNEMIVREMQRKDNITDLFSVDYIEETETRVDLGMSNVSRNQNQVLTGNLRQLKEHTSDLMIAFVNVMNSEKDIVDTTYEEIQDKVFKLKEREKDMVTDRLKTMTEESRDADTMLKVIKQGIYSKGLQKGLTVYDKDFYDDTEEQRLRDEMEVAERKIRKRRDVNDENIDILVDEYLDQQQMAQDIDQDAYDLEYLGEDYYDGNYTGMDAPEYDTYGDEN